MPHSSLIELEYYLDPSNFFRINPSDIIHQHYITRLERYEKNTVAIHLSSSSSTLKTSEKRTANFNAWLDL